jgi:hypothetical protein
VIGVASKCLVISFQLIEPYCKVVEFKETDSAAIGRDSGRRFAFLNELTGALVH